MLVGQLKHWKSVLINVPQKAFSSLVEDWEYLLNLYNLSVSRKPKPSVIGPFETHRVALLDDFKAISEDLKCPTLWHAGYQMIKSLCHMM